MTDIPSSHPRHRSLMQRELLKDGFRNGITGEAGLIAHGRGEAFDYLLGEETIPPSFTATRQAAYLLGSAENPVLSVNGNVAPLCGDVIPSLQKRFGLKVEVNLFYRTPERMENVVKYLEEKGVEDVLGLDPDFLIPGLDHPRAHSASEGIGSADVVLVPLEDGDRAQALAAMGKRVISIDLNPLSRTARTSTVCIVDEVTRAFANLLETGPLDEPDPEWKGNAENLGAVCRHVSERLLKLSFS